jgi:hypothetical protein
MVGEVWRAYDEVLGRDVAIKVLKAACVGNASRLFGRDSVREDQPREPRAVGHDLRA